ncbi:MAG: PIN domain-containing protein [Moorea sp. SIO1F2]|uniref:PIN domain-containing protein n=1 Tax=Moorena sp. SIO1F2 TaxID=2607819 RepID=UPI0013B66E54|nr:PIN domain-containing protein [Moorena sp. SIO1F2]NEO00798.1 PIN domain-containing protein [Moorena sp. SIO3I7]NEO94788.1 PIN domain-containing protein [Moorena sp. SIO3G5]NET81106.1 PIN domain-containing protein [Moorena sp. SIO1F2]
MNAVDTNILIYVNDSRDPAKQAIAISIVTGLTDGVLLWQVACEYLAASRKLEPLGYDRVQAYQYIRDLQQVWYTALPTWAVIDRAENLISRFNLSHWDSMIVAACLEANIETLYTEDFGYSDIDGLKIVNPFKSP